ncbi:zinc finger, CCHC-type containing protein [Tanacetum coccineum]|uniref:Zinc finger, CCHC-type containing protein n=1 Tax=Tanacetum coccineum TaxID=301880 RepID=A0ABQ5GF69_9ASTR
MGDENPIRTLGDYSKPSHEGYRNTIELPEGNNVVPLQSDTIRLVQKGCSFHGLRFEDPNQHLKYFLKLVDSLDLDVANRERTRLRLFQFSLRDQASNWLERLPAGSISTWEDLTTRFLAQFFPPRTAKLRNDILMFQQHQGESLYETWTRFKDLLQKVPHHGIDLWLQVQIFYDHVNPVARRIMDQSADGKLRDKNAKESYALLEDLALYDNEMNKISSSCEICSSPHDTQYCIENPEQAFVEYASSRIDEAGRSITTWEDLTTCFLAQIFPPRRTAKLCNDILMFQQHHGESLSEAWTRFKDLLQKFPHHGLDLWLQVQIFYDHVDNTIQKSIDYVACGRLRKLRPYKAWAVIERLAQYENEGRNDAFVPEDVRPNYGNPNIKQLLGIMEHKVDTLMKDAILLMGKSESVFRLATNEMYRPPSEPSRQEEIEHIVMNFVLDQEERIRRLEDYMQAITYEFMEFSSEVT